MRNLVILLMVFSVGCGNTNKTVTNYDVIRNYAREAKKQENITFKRTIAEETIVHKAQQTIYNDIIKHPEKHADIVDLSTGQNVPDTVPPTNGIPDFNNPNTPEVFTIPPKINKSIFTPDCKECQKEKK